MEDYSAKLTGEPFLYRETKIIGEYLHQGFEASELKKKNIEENLIQYKSKSAISRVNSAIFRRLNVLNADMLEEFVNGDLYTSRMLLVYSIMKTDKLVCDFISELYKDKILLMKENIEQYEVVNWFDRKFAESINLSKVSDKTQYKLRQVMMKIMIDSGLVMKEKDCYKIIIPILSDKFKLLLDNAGDSDYYKAIGGLV